MVGFIVAVTLYNMYCAFFIFLYGIHIYCEGHLIDDCCHTIQEFQIQENIA